MTNIQTGKCQCGDICYSLHKNKIISAHHFIVKIVKQPVLEKQQLFL